MTLTLIRRKISPQISVSSAALGAALCVWAPGAASAQEADPETGVDAAVDTIIVTARKIEEPIQRIPFGITVFNADEIGRRDIRDARSFGRSAPGFNFVETGLRGSSIPNIRGTGSFFPQSSDDGSVPVFIDGVPAPLRAQDREFFDIERIEVLRGPQNTLYGRNAQAGAISIVTADPVFEHQYEIGGEIGNIKSRRATALANTPLSDELALRIAAQYDTRDGFIPDINRDDDVGDREVVNLHGKLLWAPDDDTEVKLAVRYGDYFEDPTQGVFVENPEFPQAFTDTSFIYDLETLGAGLTARRAFGRWSLTSITGYQDYTNTFVTDDTDGLILGAISGFPPAAFNDPRSDFRVIRDDGFQVSQEVQVSGELDNGVQLVGGLYYFHSELDFGLIFNATGFLNAEFANEFSTDSYAGFVEATVPVGDRLRLIGGVRYTHEDRGFEGAFQDLSGDGPVPSAFDDGERDFDFVTGRAAATFDLLPTLTAFASVARGAKSGGFQLADTDVANGFEPSQFDSALTWAYEAGLRGQLAGGLVDFSVSGFFNDTKGENLQVFEVLIFQSVIENADTESYGFEIETVLRLSDNFNLSGGFALAEAEITASDDPTVSPGNDVPFAPSVAYNIAADYRQPVTVFGKGGGVFGRVEYQFTGERTSDPQNRLTVDGFDLLNLRAGWDCDAFSVYAFASNVLDNTYVETAFLFGNAPDGANVSAGIPGQPRRYGLGAKIRF